MVLVAAGCGDDIHCPRPPSDRQEAPHITELTFSGQLDEDPWTTVLALAFTDSNGNLGRATAPENCALETTRVVEVYIEGREPALRLCTFTLFRASGVLPSATSGEIGLPLRFTRSGPGEVNFWVGVQLVDAGALRSNCYAAELEYLVE